MVAILGFNYFGEDTNYVTDRILKVSASHFLPAILDKRMTVTIDNRLVSGDTIRANSSNIGSFLDPSGAVSRRKNCLFPEGLAYRSYRTISEGSELEHNLGTLIKLRLLEGKERNTRVNIFREGMWITWEAPGLEPSKFAGYRQFDAVVLPNPQDSPNDLYQLIRTSEGPDHMDVDLANLNSREKKKLEGLFAEVCDLLKEKAGEVEGETFVPQGFADFPLGSVSKAERLRTPARTPRSSNNSEEGGGRGDSGGSSNGGKREPRNRPNVPAGQPKKGRPAEVPLSAREIIEDGKIIGFDCYINEHSHPKLGVRVLRETGSDETCDQLLANKFFEIVDSSGTKQSDPYEIETESFGRLKVNLKQPFPVGEGVLTIDLVVRK